MSISNVPSDLLQDWISSVALSNGITPGPGSGALVNSILATMSDIDKTASLTSYLNGRISSDQAQINSLPQYVQDQTNKLNADISACQTALSKL